MPDIITVLCNGDFHGRDLARQQFSISDIELLIEQMKKAAATNSDPIR
ncbi:hypothetical protein [Sporomusa sp. KB1]|jgi:hypothetical protein|nr:hypothetical protein [Sporomusa sp. KB1]TWH49621.1 hypothetical protein Salpa_5860 [Sporomusa sp. KB1]